MVGDPKKMKVVDIAIDDIQIDKPEKDQGLTTADIRVYGPPNYAVRTLTRKETWHTQDLPAAGSSSGRGAAPSDAQ